MPSGDPSPLEAPSPETAPGSLAPAGSDRRWLQLQGLRRGGLDLEPLLQALERGDEPADVDLLAALIGRVDRPAVARLLQGPAAVEPRILLQAGLQELPALASLPAVQEAWLQPLLGAYDALDPGATGAAPASWGRATRAAMPWLMLLGQFRSAAAACRLRRGVRAALAGLQNPGESRSPVDTTLPTARHDGEPAAAACQDPEAMLAVLLPLLGRQRCPEDGALLLRLALQPGPLTCRQAALEGLAVGLSAWPQPALRDGLQTLAGDLSPALAAVAVDLLARLPDATSSLRRLWRRPLDPGVRARLRRRLRPTPLVLVVHGRQGGVIPVEWQRLAADLAEQRGTNVHLQALTAPSEPADGSLWRDARRAGGLTLVPLFLLPGGHVRRDLPELASRWRQVVAAAGDLTLWRMPFLGSWPNWQRRLNQRLQELAAGRPLVWLHHPLDGPLGERHLAHLGELLGQPGRAAAYTAAPEGDLLPQAPSLIVPWTLAANRLSESLAAEALHPGSQLLPPLLQDDGLRQVVLDELLHLA